MAKFVLARHGESTWKREHRWTGLTDVDLTSRGREQMRHLAQHISDIVFGYGYSSELKRAGHSLDEVARALGNANMKIAYSAAFNERDYGQYTGMNKLELADQMGEDEFLRIRRGWDVPIPGGETLKEISGRAVPAFRKLILPKLMAGKNVLLVAHNNTNRTIAKDLENTSDEGVAKVEQGVGEAWVYDIDDQGKMTAKEIRTQGIVM